MAAMLALLAFMGIMFLFLWRMSVAGRRRAETAERNDPLIAGLTDFILWARAALWQDVAIVAHDELC